MVDRNNNGIDDSLELADALGVEAPPPPQRATGGGTSPSEDEVSRIFAGDIRVPLYDSGIGRESVGRIPIEQTREQALAEFGAFSDKDRRRLAKLAEAAGVDTKFSSLQWFWQQGVNNAEAAYAAGQRVSPWDYLESWASEPAARRASGVGAGAYMGPRTTTSVSVTAKEDVERTLNTFAVDMLGRNLTDDELKKYTAQYREQEIAAPQVTRTQGGGAAATSMTEQTVSRETIAQNILQDNPMFADNVIKTDVLDMFFNRLGGAAGGS